MAQRNAAAVDVQLVLVDAQGALAGHTLGSKGFVDLEEVDIGHGEASLLQHLLGGADGADAHQVGGNAGGGHSDYAGQDGQSQLFGKLLLH